jgi:hypothetical protein
MEAADITALTAAFDPSQFVTVMLGVSAFIIGVIGIEIVMGIVKGGVRKVKGHTKSGF